MTDHEKKIIYTDENDSRTPAEAAKENDIIELDQLTIICTRDEKGRRVVPADIMDNHYKDLPQGTRSTDGRAAYNGGCLRMLDAMNQEEAAEIHKQGGEALQAANRQRRSMAESIDDMLKSKAGQEEIKRYNLRDGATKQEALLAAMYHEAINKGTVRAADFLRDTVGEKPVERQQVQADITTEADRLLMEKIQKRLREME